MSQRAGRLRPRPAWTLDVNAQVKAGPRGGRGLDQPPNWWRPVSGPSAAPSRFRPAIASRCWSRASTASAPSCTWPSSGAGPRPPGATSSTTASTTWPCSTRGRWPSSTTSPAASSSAETVLALVEGMAAACRAAGVALIGGETAQMPDTYRAGAYDVAGTMIGIAERAAHARSVTGPGRRRHRGRALGRAAHQRLQPRAQDGRGAGARTTRWARERWPMRLLAPHPSYYAELAGRLRACRACGSWPTSPAAGWKRTCRACCPRASVRASRSEAWAVPPVFDVIAADQGVDASRDVPRLQHGHRPGHRGGRRETRTRCCGPCRCRSGPARSSSAASRAWCWRGSDAPGAAGVGARQQRRRHPHRHRRGPARGRGCAAHLRPTRRGPGRGRAPRRAGPAHRPAVTTTTGAAQQSAIRDALLEAGVDFVALAGFAAILEPVVVDAFEGRILNIHPSLLPVVRGHRGARAPGRSTPGRGQAGRLHRPRRDRRGRRAGRSWPGGRARPARRHRRVAGGRILVEEHRLYPRCCSGSQPAA